MDLFKSNQIKWARGCTSTIWMIWMKIQNEFERILISLVFDTKSTATVFWRPSPVAIPIDCLPIAPPPAAGLVNEVERAKGRVARAEVTFQACECHTEAKSVDP